MKQRYSISLSPQIPNEVEVIEIEESEQFVAFQEEPQIYEGKRKESFSVIFVDGVRRTEALAYVKDEEKGEHFEGAFVSLGAGALRIEHGRVNLVKESLILSNTKRTFFLRGNLPIKELWDFVIIPVDGEISVEVNRYMKEELEASIARQAWQKFSTDLVICDGTLSNKLRNTQCVGFVKSIRKLYFDNRYLNLLYELKPGQRSPIIKVHYQSTQEEKEKVDKYAWYIKLSPEGGMHSLARLEIFPQWDMNLLREIADLSAGILPYFASQPFQDRRAPQNLLPVGKLENFLRRHLGPYGIIRKQILEWLKSSSQ